MPKRYLNLALLALLPIWLLSSFPASAQLPISNIDFVLANFTNWSCYTGISITGSAATGPIFSAPVLSGPVSNRHIITGGTLADPISGMPLVAPASLDSLSARIGNDQVGAEADRIRYYIHVPAGTTKFSLQTQFSVILEDPAHMPEEQPSFQVVAYDSASGAIIPSANNLYISGYAVPGFLPLAGGSVLYLPWTNGTVNLGGMGGKTVILEVNALDCAPSGHFGYGYFDVTGVTTYLAPTALRCDQDSILLQGPAGYKYYQWFDQSFSTAMSGATDTNRNQMLSLPSSAQYYNLVLTPFSSTGIPDTIRTNMLNPPFTISASGASLCASVGVPVQLNTTVTGTATGLRYAWSGDTATLNNQHIPNPVALPAGPGTYIVTVSDTNGCYRRDTVSLQTGSFRVNVGADTVTCLGNSLVLGATVVPTAPGYTYAWSPSANLSNAAAPNPVYTPSAAGWAQLILRVDSGICSIYDTLLVHTLQDTFATVPVTTCAGQSSQLTVLGDSAYSYSWTPASRLSFANGDQRPTFAADTTTTFTITATHPGCSAVTGQLTVTVEPVPQVNLGADTVYLISSSPAAISAQVLPSSFSGYTYSWQPANLLDSPSRPTVHYLGSSDTTLYVMVQTPAGCSGFDSVVVINVPSVARMPNAFVPGSVNASFRVSQIAPGYSFRSLRIYDRWGRRVFETADANAGWDGSTNGNNAPLGVYVYVLEAVSGNGLLTRQQGNVTLIR